MVRCFASLLLVSFSLALVSCADTTPANNQPGQVSTIPWNRPEKWEGTGMMPGMSGTR